MIRITCTHCRQLLTIDDGFAGGVCRCQHCGTIQTVPAAPGKSQGRGPVPAAKTLYRAEGRKSDSHGGEPHIPSGSGLDQLAEIVSSSGLTHSARASRPPGGNGMGRPSAAKPPRRLAPLLIIAAVVIFLLLAVIVVLLVKSGQFTLPIRSPSSTTPPPAPVTEVAPNGPGFCGMPIEAQDTVIYVLDNGGSASDTLPAMSAACLQSIKSLTPERRFKVLFWRDGSPVYPKDGTVRATPDEIANCQTAIQDVFAQGNTDPDAALKIALSAQPDAIVLVTAKAGELTDDFANSVLSIRGDSVAKIYTVGINGDSTGDPTKPGVLATLADKTGGKFLNLSSADLNRLSHQ
jgi:hypothetical protein